MQTLLLLHLVQLEQLFMKYAKFWEEKTVPVCVEFSISKHDVTEGTGHFLQKFEFPQVIGSIDGTQIPIKQPSKNAHGYSSYKMS